MDVVTIDGIPVYQALVDAEDCGMIRISLVEDPAVQSNFLAFDKQKRVQMYSVQDEEKRLVMGVVMRADFPIYRIDERNGEFFIIYKADTIRKMAEKYLLESRQNAVDLQHNGQEVDGVQMVQYFIKGGGLQPEGFEGIADGSLFAEFHITNDTIWQAIKDGTYKGFSLEGIFDLTPERNKARVEEIVDALDGVFSRILRNNQTYEKMKKKGILARLAAMLVEMGNITTDKGILAWDGDEDLKEGDSVSIEDAEGNRTPAADGDYITGDNKTIVVVDGKVSEIRDPEAEVASEGEEESEGEEMDSEVKAKREEKMSRKQKFEESYDEKMRKIYDALYAVRADDGWYIQEAGDDFALVCAWDEDYIDHFFRYPVSWNEDGTANVGEPVEVKYEVVPLDYVSPFETKEEETEETEETEDAALRSENESLKAENEALKSQIEEMSRKPAAQPAHEEFEGSMQFSKTGNKGLDRLARLLSAK